MKSKTLIAVAVVSTFGWSAASFAGPSHQVVTPFSPNESGENIFHYERGFGSSGSPDVIGATSDEAGGTVSGSYGSSVEQSASIGTDERLAAADNGLYNDFYIVSWAPVTGDAWDYYVIDDGGTPQLVALSDYDVWMPLQDQLVLIPSMSTPDETVYELALVPMRFDANSGSRISDDASGE